MVAVYYDRMFPYGFVGVVFLAIWFGLGMLTYNFINSDDKADGEIKFSPSIFINFLKHGSELL